MLTLLTALVTAQLAVGLPGDSIESLRRHARSAEAHFERQARRLAPYTWNAPTGSTCDEIVGRFCLTFGPGTSTPTPEEAGRVADARRDAIEAVRRYFAAAPADRRAAGPLVRLLIADNRPREALAAAAAYEALARDSLWAPLLVGIASHAAGLGEEAERSFQQALDALPAPERARWAAPAWLLDPDERRRVQRMPSDQRADYERRFWAMSDPFWATSYNELFSEHMARHAQARLMADVPIVAGMVRWGDDLSELTVRYGTPTSRRQTYGTITAGSSAVEYWDSAQRKFTPARLSAGVAAAPLPGETPHLYDERARTGYAPAHLDRVVELPHQVSRFLRGNDVLLRVDVDLSALAAGRREGVLVVRDSALVRSRGGAPILMAGDEAALFAAGPEGFLVYSAEVFVQGVDSVRSAGRARYGIDARVPRTGPVLSDILLARPFRGYMPRGADDPRILGIADLTVNAGDTIAAFGEGYRLGAETTVEVSLEPAGRGSLLRQLGGWIGRATGVHTPAPDPRTRWIDSPRDEVHIIAVDLPLDPRRRGMHDLVVRVTSEGVVTESRRRFLIR